jgi:hypothetical protein
MAFAIAACCSGSEPRAADANYDEASVRTFTLPEVLAGPDGKLAASPDDWKNRCRPHQLALLEANVYGRRLPAVPVQTVGEFERTDVTLAGDIKATRLQARLRLGEKADAPVIDAAARPRLPLPQFPRQPVAAPRSRHPHHRPLGARRSLGPHRK